MKLLPIPRNFTPTIAKRDLILVSDGKRRQVTVRLGQPVQDVPTVSGLDWRCPIQITGLRKRRMPPGIGVDSLQALVHALKVVEAELNAAKGRAKFLWLEDPGDGMPEIQLAVPGLSSRLNKRLQRAATPRDRGKTERGLGRRG